MPDLRRLTLFYRNDVEIFVNYFVILEEIDESIPNHRIFVLVESLIYWRDPKKSGPVFAGVLIVLLALTYFSLISVVAYLSLVALSGTVSFRIYKNVVQAVQKTGDGHPFK